MQVSMRLGSSFTVPVAGTRNALSSSDAVYNSCHCSAAFESFMAVETVLLCNELMRDIVAASCPRNWCPIRGKASSDWLSTMPMTL
jgi:hypothetical protein